jgi:hypothetical protein
MTIDVGGDLSTLNRFVFLDPSWDSENRKGMTFAARALCTAAAMVADGPLERRAA